jgi:ATP-dependent protease ClpP protease subunit
VHSQSPSGIFIGGSQHGLVQSFESKNPSDKAFYLYGPVEDPEEYVDLIHEIRYAEPEQQITLHINSGGGALSTCLSIINAIKASQAEVVTVIDGEACSAAAMIWLAGHRRVIASKHVFFMLHEAGWAMVGNASEHQRQVLLLKKIIRGLIDDLALWVVTPEELEDFDKGIDVYITGDQIVERGTKANGDVEDALNLPPVDQE